MLSGMRKGLGRFGAVAILVVLAVAIGIFGIQDVLRGGVSDSVASVNKREISARDYQAGFDRAVKRMQQRAPPPCRGRGSRTAAPPPAAADG